MHIHEKPEFARTTHSALKSEKWLYEKCGQRNAQNKHFWFQLHNCKRFLPGESTQTDLNLDKGESLFMESPIDFLSKIEFVNHSQSSKCKLPKQFC